MLKWFRDINVAMSNATTPHALFEARAFQIFNWVGRALVNDPSVERMLDLGAGRTWYYGDNVKRGRNLTIIGFDIDGEEMAHNTMLDQRIVGNASVSLDVPHGSLDLIICRATIEHVPDNAKLVANCFRALKPGGKFAVVFANKWSLPALLNMIIPQWMARRLLYALVPNSRDYQGFTTYYDRCSHSQFTGLLRESGFSIHYAYNSYYSSSYFQFFWPLHVLSILNDLIRSTLSIRDLCAQNLYVAVKP